MLTADFTNTTSDEHAMTIEEWMQCLAVRLVDDMKGNGIEDPLGEPLTLAAVLYDLLVISGSAVPTIIAERIGS